jgi:hypothetical protein
MRTEGAGICLREVGRLCGGGGPQQTEVVSHGSGLLHSEQNLL